MARSGSEFGLAIEEGIDLREPFEVGSAFHTQASKEGIDKVGSVAHSTADTDGGWQDFANCLGVDPDLFFPERGASTREAKEVCRSCVVRDDCLDFALGNSEKFGIWGGMSERERRRIRRQRAIARREART